MYGNKITEIHMSTKTKQASSVDYLWFAAMIIGMLLVFSGNNFGWLLIVPCLVNLD